MELKEKNLSVRPDTIENKPSCDFCSPPPPLVPQTVVMELLEFLNYRSKVTDNSCVLLNYYFTNFMILRISSVVLDIVLC